MSVATTVTLHCRLPDKAKGGRNFVAYGDGPMFSELLVDRDGACWEIFSGDDGVESSREPYLIDGPMNVQGVDASDYSLLFRGGKLVAVRPGRYAWLASCKHPGGAPGQLTEYRSRYPDSRDFETIERQAWGLPDLPSDRRWCISPGGELTALDVTGPVHRVDELEPYPFHGWLFLSGFENGESGTAMRFASGRRQWEVPVVEGGATRPATMSELGLNVAAEPRTLALRAACRVLPTDYTDYGGDAVRWELEEDGDPDCSSGCRHFAALHDPEHVGPDGDWGVCTNASGPRCGLLTWEHQAGRGCYVGPAADCERAATGLDRPGA